jgi:hypothetical protein
MGMWLRPMALHSSRRLLPCGWRQYFDWLSQLHPAEKRTLFGVEKATEKPILLVPNWSLSMGDIQKHVNTKEWLTISLVILISL